MKELTGWSDESDETPDNVRSQLDQMHWRVLNRRQNQSPTVRRSDIHVVSGNWNPSPEPPQTGPQPSPTHRQSFETFENR